MTTRTVINRETEVRCQAKHPQADKQPRFHGRRCDNFIVRLPFAMRFTGRLLEDLNDVRPGYVPARCPKCNRISEFEVVAPTEASA